MLLMQIIESLNLIIHIDEVLPLFSSVPSHQKCIDKEVYLHCTEFPESSVNFCVMVVLPICAASLMCVAL